MRRLRFHSRARYSEALTVAVLCGLLVISSGELRTARAPERLQVAPAAPAPLADQLASNDLSAPDFERPPERAPAPRILKTPQDLRLPPVFLPPQTDDPELEQETDALCGDLRLIGRRLEPLDSERDARCGAEAPVLLESVAGMSFEPAPRVTCDMARGLADLAEKVAGPPSARLLGASVTELVVYDHYSCRTRNGQPGAELSQHAFANAIDIGAFRLDNGETISVLDDWSAGDAPDEAAARRSAYLRSFWRIACETVSTVLGPEANAFHANHFHLDAKKRDFGNYCR